MMMIAIRCPHCSKSHDVPEESLGKQATCQDCGRSFMATGSHDETVAFVQGQTAGSDGGTRRASPRTRIGRYEFRERLGAGVFGTVYRAYDAVLDRDVAVKVPQAAALDSADARERFFREARAAGRLRHPHIVPVYDCGQEGDEVFIVAAFIEGQTLAAAIAAGQVDHRRAVSIAAKLAHALGTAHHAGIVHRDVKPANVMLDERGEPQLTDFGLAQLGSTSHLTQQGMLLGTPAYMSPEQALGDQSQVGPASDQYSLGVLLYEMLCGRIPFEGPPLTVLYRVREEAPAAPRSIDPTIPPALEAVCLKAMAKRPSDRFADCAELSDSLRQLDLNACAEKPPESAPAAVVRAPFETPTKSRETAREPVRPKPEAPLRPAADSGAFDPYHKWLAIPTNERPPTHYQILSVAPSETDRDVINTAALQRSAYVRNFQAGRQGELATRILNEIAAALACLLDPARRVVYDAELRKTRPRAAEIKAAASPAGGAAATIAPQMPLDLGLLAAAEPLAPPAWMLPPPRRRNGLPWWGVASAVGGVAVLVLVAMIALSGGDPPPTDASDSQPATGTESASRSAAAAQDAVESVAADAGARASQPEATSTASASFDATQAKARQEAWAANLGVPVEFENSIGMKFVLIPPGEFMMGSTPGEIEEALRLSGEDEFAQACIKAEGPQHRVVLTRPVYLGAYEVTQSQYKSVMEQNPSHFAETGAGKASVVGLDTATHPVETVNWNDAAEFCAKLSQQEKLKPIYVRSGETVTQLEGTGYRLPTEAEWEFACRAGTTTKYWVGDKDEDLPRAGWFDENSGPRTHAVGELEANPFGLYDVHGNVWEWVQDAWGPPYYGQFADTPVLDPMGATSDGANRLVRGGVWFRTADRCRASHRNFNPSVYRNLGIGFRVALPVEAVRNALLAPQVAEAASSVAVQPPWPADAVEFQGHRYKVFYEQLSWRQAKAKCQEMGGHLPIVTSQEENAFLVQLFRSGLAAPQQLDGLWLGATDEVKEGAWLWVDGTPLTFRNWAVGQPNNKQAEHFLFLWVGRNGSWADQPNVSTQHRAFYACEWDASSAGDAPTSLFDGSTLQGWEGDPARWNVANGILVGHKPAGVQGDTYLATRDSYDNFVLTMKFHLVEGNSGIQFRGEVLPDRRMTGYSADLAYHDNFKYLGWLFLTGQPAPCASPSATQQQRMIESLGDDGWWNEYRVTADGNHIVLEINGVEVVNTRHDGPTRGRIGLQLHGGATATTVEFKDIELRALPGPSPAPVPGDMPANPPALERPDDGFRPLFNGTDLTGWRVIGGQREGWVRGGVLVSDGAEGNLATEAEYSDFELSLEFRIGRNGNSGIFLRAADGDKTAQDCAEVQIYDDSTATDVKPDQRTGSIYSFVAASPPNSVSPGQWQTMVIRMQGTTVLVTLDDTIRVNADLTRHRDRLKGYVNRRRGYIKLQHHAGRVEFRNIRIRELP